MDRRRTFNNQVLIKLDPENELIKLKDGMELYVDTNFDPEKHATVTGEIYGLPSKLLYTGKPNVGMPWDTNMEVRYGDRVIVYYLSVINAINPKKAYVHDSQKCIVENGDRYVIIPYSSIFAVYGEGFVKPVNGYCLIEPCEDPNITAERERMKKVGVDLVKFDKKSTTNVVYGKVRYLGKPNRSYVDDGVTDEGCDIRIGEMVVLRRTYDIPLCYDLHAKIDKGTKLWRVQRRNILARL